MPLRNGLTKAKSFSKRHSHNDREALVVQMRRSSMVSSIRSRRRKTSRTGQILARFIKFGRFVWLRWWGVGCLRAGGL